jgi:hypothetical protein
LSTPDVDASVAFYGDLFGWEATEAGPAEETVGDRMFSQHGEWVAGVGPLQGEEQPPVWTTYIATGDADETARRAEEAGGTVLAPPFDVMDAGRMAIIQDPTGAVFGVWQAGGHKGAGLFNEPVSLTWNELRTRDLATGERFYSDVFGWEPRERDIGGVTYTQFFNGIRAIGGMLAMTGQWPAEVPPHWDLYFTVGDVRDRAADRGGTRGRAFAVRRDGRLVASRRPRGGRRCGAGRSRDRRP